MKRRELLVGIGALALVSAIGASAGTNHGIELNYHRSKYGALIIDSEYRGIKFSFVGGMARDLKNKHNFYVLTEHCRAIDYLHENVWYWLRPPSTRFNAWIFMEGPLWKNRSVWIDDKKQLHMILSLVKPDNRHLVTQGCLRWQPTEKGEEIWNIS